MNEEEIINNGFEIIATYFTNVYAYALPQNIKVQDSANAHKLFRRELRNKIESYRDAFCHKDNEKYYISIIIDIVRLFNDFNSGVLISEIEFIQVMCKELATKSALTTLNMSKKKALFKRFICESLVRYTAHVSYELDDLIKYKTAEFLTDDMKEDETNLAKLWKSKMTEILEKVRDEIYNQFMSLDSGVNPRAVTNSGNERAALKSLVRKLRELLSANAELRKYVAKQDKKITELEREMDRYKSQNSSQSIENERLKEKLSKTESSGLLQVQIENLKTENEDLRATIDELSNELSRNDDELIIDN